VNVRSGAPFGYRCLRRNEHAEARYDVVVHEAALVAELFLSLRRGGVSIAELARWLTSTRSAHSNRQVPIGPIGDLGDAGQPHLRRARLLWQHHAHADQPGLNRTARLAGRSTPKSCSVTEPLTSAVVIQ
jgi:site-specific DNA recombinase